MKSIPKLLRPGPTLGALALLTATFAGESPQIAWMAAGHSYGATGIRFTSGGRYLVSGGTGLKVWDLDARRLERTLSTPRGGDDGLALSSDDRWVASVPWSPDRGLFIREVSNGAEHARFPLDDQSTPPVSLSFSPDNAWLLASTASGFLLRWHLPSRTALAPLRIDTIKPDLQYGFWAASVSSNEFIGSTSTSVFRAQVEPPQLVWDLAVSARGTPAVGPGAQMLAVALADRLMLIDASSGQAIRETEPMADPPAHLAFSVDGRRVVGTQQGTDLRIWQTSDATLELALPGVAESVSEVAVSPDGRTVAAGYGGGIALWDLDARLGPEDLTQLPAGVYSVGAATNGLVAAGTLRGHVAVFELATGRRLALWRPTTGFRPIAVAPSGDWLVTDGVGESLSVYRLPFGGLEREVPLPGANPDFLDLSANGERLAVVPRQGGPVVVRTSDWTVERTVNVYPDPCVLSAHLSPEGDRLVSVLVDGSVAVWLTSNGALSGRLSPSGAEPASVAFDDPAPAVWVLTKDGGVMRWNPVTGDVEARPSLTTGNIVHALWLPDRSAVLLSVQDQGLQLWRLDTGACVQRYDAEVGRVCYDLDLTADGRTLLLGRYDATLVAAGPPFFLDLQPSTPGEQVIQPHGTKAPLRWDAMTPPDAWSTIRPAAIGPLTVPTSTPGSQWIRAVIE